MFKGEIIIKTKTMEYDEFVKMSPVKTWTVRMRIKSIEKAKMRIVEPE